MNSSILSINEYDEKEENLILSNSDFEDDYNEVKEEKKEDTIWDELSTLVKQLEHYDYDVVKKYIDNEMLDDKADLIEEFEKDFSDIDNTDTLKLEVLVLLGKLGITIYS